MVEEAATAEAGPGATVAGRLKDVRMRMDAAARQAGREPGSITLMAVTQGFPRESVEEALAAGLSLFGENRVQEAEVKFADLAGPVSPGRCELHLIGHLQRNKARTACGVFACVQSIDKVETAEALSVRCAERGRNMDILLELNTSGESSKSGFLSPDDLLRALERIALMPALRVRGLMTVGPLTEDNARVRTAFASLRALFDRVRSTGGPAAFDVLSMGMSGDYEAAIGEGSTLVRIGTALFGRRGPA